jgi:hypothetical protein
MVSKDGARYQPVAWWFTRRQLGRELRKLYQAIEELPPQLLALVRKLEGGPDSLEAKGRGCGSPQHHEMVLSRGAASSYSRGLP